MDRKDDQERAAPEGQGPELPRNDSSANAEAGHGEPRILSEDDCLRALSQLAALVAMGVFSTKQADTMRGIYSSILAALRNRNTARNGLVSSTGDLAAILRQQPELANSLAPILTREQVEAYLNGAE